MPPTEALLVPLVIGLVQVTKEAGFPHRFLPIATLFIAGGLGYFIGVNWIMGLVYGLTAMGLWSGTKTLSGN